MVFILITTGLSDGVSYAVKYKNNYILADISYIRLLHKVSPAGLESPHNNCQSQNAPIKEHTQK
jgi:hypothetical protein